MVMTSEGVMIITGSRMMGCSECLLCSIRQNGGILPKMCKVSDSTQKKREKSLGIKD